MRYYLIAGEASGDLHASHLMDAIRQEDPQAEFRGIGGDMMEAQGATLIRHYRQLAYMGILPVLRHLPTILAGMKACRSDIPAWQPDALILVDYPGFNLSMAKYVHTHTRIPVFYYISPKIWAWKEHRIRDIRRYVDTMLSILPFEVDFYEHKHHYPIHYVGNPTVDEVDAYLRSHPADARSFCLDNGLDSRPVIALLAGSRRQEIRDNLPRMVEAALSMANHYQLVVAAAPGIPDDYYHEVLADQYKRLKDGQRPGMVRNQTYRLLQHSAAALVTSGTATLETALLNVPQVVCYYMWAGRLASLARKLVLKIPFVSLVNLVAGEEVVPELVAEQMNVHNLERHLKAILPGGDARQAQLEGYRRMAGKLGEPGAPEHAAHIITERLASAR
ncbi:MAG: lipid-A-disaccharide synthase [Bacteroidaceae bacterium]